MKEFAVLLLLALILNGCGDNHVPNPQVAAGGVTHQHDLGRVGPELGGVRADPAHGGRDVAHVSGVLDGGGQAVVDAHVDHAATGPVHAVMYRRCPATGNEPTAVDPHHDRQRLTTLRG